MSASLERHYENNGRYKILSEQSFTHSSVYLFTMKVGHPVGLYV